MLGQQINGLAFGEAKRLDPVEQLGIDDRCRWQLQRGLLEKDTRNCRPVTLRALLGLDQLDADIGPVGLLDGRLRVSRSSPELGET